MLSALFCLCFPVFCSHDTLSICALMLADMPLREGRMHSLIGISAHVFFWQETVASGVDAMIPSLLCTHTLLGTTES